MAMKKIVQTAFRSAVEFLKSEVTRVNPFRSGG
jgi:hypothetical protein